MWALTRHYATSHKGLGTWQKKNQKWFQDFLQDFRPCNLNTSHCNATQIRIFGLHNWVLLGPKEDLVQWGSKWIWEGMGQCDEYDQSILQNFQRPNLKKIGVRVEEKGRML